MSIVNTNYLSLSSQNHINKNQRSLNTAIERLSLGTRVNSAKDDSANSSIINPFTANIKGLTQAVRNGNDGLSIAQTTEGSLTEINDSLQKIRTLTVQALNETNSSTDLQFIQDEINARLAEIDRVSAETKFNRLHVLGSGAKPLNIQIGAYDNETITIDLQQIDNQTLGISDFNITKPINESHINDSVADKYIQSKRVPSDLDFSATTYYAANVNSETGEVTQSNALTTAAESKDPLAKLDTALQKVGDLRSHLGAVQNRLISSITSIDNSIVHLSATRSRLEDADFAAEVSNKSRLLLLQQTSTTMLAQANQVPELVLSLLS